MRDSRSCLLTLATLMVVAMLLSGGAWAAGNPEIWPTYHKDSGRVGQNANSTDILPGDINLIWAFPRQSSKYVQEDLTIVDNIDPNGNFIADGWKTGLIAADPWKEDFIYADARARTRDDGSTQTKTALATWYFPPTLPKGYYQVMIWVPGSLGDTTKHPSTQAEYTVYDDTGASTIKFNQTQGGAWVLLTTRYFQFLKGGGNTGYRVELSNLTDDKESAITDNSIIVMADAIKFTPGTGGEIYTSPVSANIQWSVSGTYTAGTYSGPYTWPKNQGDLTPVVYVGAIESPINATGAPDLGVVHCVNSITATTRRLDSFTLPIETADWAQANGLAQYLGTDVWRFPRTPDKRQTPRVAGGDVDELEGPIEGGIYATPTLYRYSSGGSERLAVCLAAEDRQVYAFDATTGELLWKGPGVTRSEDNANMTSWTEVSNRDAFGGRFCYTKCVDAASTERKTATWLFSDAARHAGGEPSTGGWSYSVYAWVPAREGDPQRTTTASYTIHYIGVKNGAASADTAEVEVDQSSSSHGEWVKIGSSYFNVSKVELSNVIKGSNPGNYTVAADAVMIVPDAIDGFGYCTPVWDGTSTVGTGGGALYVGNSVGRVLRFELDPQNTGDPMDKVGKCDWVYPTIRTSLKTDDEAPALGEMGSSPAYCSDTPGKLFIAGMDGHVRCLTNLGGSSPTETWMFPAESEEAASGFTSSVCVDPMRESVNQRRQLYIGSVSGVFYSIDSDNGKLLWQYPEANANGAMPLPGGAFRYSTATVTPDQTGLRRVWAASTDGHIYSFDTTAPMTSKERRIWVEFNDDGTIKQEHGLVWYVEPQVLQPIQASLAFDGHGTPTQAPYMYVGDMRDRGVLRWFEASTGATPWTYKGWVTEGQLFSSPNISEIQVGSSGKDVSYIYNGASDGRLYAWSHSQGAYGGGWSGGEWPFPGEPDSHDNMEEGVGPDTDVQFDIFPATFYDQTFGQNPDPMLANGRMTMGMEVTSDKPWPNYPADAPADKQWAVGMNMKQVGADYTNTLDPNKDPDGYDDAIDVYLTKTAKERRKYAFEQPTRTDKNSDELSTIYFEWGETIYAYVWNLPEASKLYSRDNPVTVYLANTSSGSSSGTTSRTTAQQVAPAREYHVLSRTEGNDNGQKWYSNLTYSAGGKHKGAEVKRSYWVGVFKLTPSNVPTPGPGWTMTAEVRTKNDDGSMRLRTIPLARLTMRGGIPDISATPAVKGGPLINIKPQLVGINNPLAIRDDNNGSGTFDANGAISWPGNATTFGIDINTRHDPEAHYNGNDYYDNATRGFGTKNLPVVNLDLFDADNTERGIMHGTGSREARLGIMDRSAMGAAGSSLTQFRINADDLRWHGGDQAITIHVGTVDLGIKFPWEKGIGSADYPNISKSNETFRKQSDDKDPAKTNTSLPAILPGRIVNTNLKTYENGVMRPDSVFITAQVPKYQPANLGSATFFGNRLSSTGRTSELGYSHTMQAYIDSNGRNGFDSGNTVRGRPTTYQEAYRKFRVGLRVPPDPRIEVDEQTIDVGKAAHGMGQAIDFVSVNQDPRIRQWFKKITIKNSGNINLFNVQLYKSPSDVNLWQMKDGGLFYTNFSAIPRIPGPQIRSALDNVLPTTTALQPLKAEPFVTFGTNWSHPEVTGYTLNKPRVGDPDPMVMSIPERRKWNEDYGGTQSAATSALATAIRDTTTGVSAAQATAIATAKLPMPTDVSVAVPISTPLGTYQAPFVPVWCDLNNNGVLDSGEPFAAPTFQLKVTVQQDQVTGGEFPACLPQVDLPMTDGKFPRLGDSTPAAYRDQNTGNVYMFWSSNRMINPSYYPNWDNPNDTKNADFANAPWFICRAALNWAADSNLSSCGWAPVTSGNMDKWWETPGSNPYLPAFMWPSVLANAKPGSTVMKWKVDGTDTNMLSVRHHSPAVFDDDRVPKDANSARTWVAWIGTANILNQDQTVSREHRIFYTDATHGNVSDNASSIFGIEQDPGSEKRYPSLAVMHKGNLGRMWTFWQAADSDKWAIEYSTNTATGSSGAPKTYPTDKWTSVSKLRTPDCLSSAASPNALDTLFGGSNDNSAHHVLDVIYAGTSKLGQTPDILLSKYAAAVSGDSNSRNALPSQRAQPMPRVYGEKLQRDPKYGFFTSEHIAWVRLSRSSLDKLPTTFANAADLAEAIKDHTDYLSPQRKAWVVHNTFDTWLGGKLTPDPSNGSALNELYSMPCIYVKLPVGYDDTIKSDLILSATDGVIPEMDDATGACVYKYKEGTPQAQYLGQTIVDYSAGIVRFTKGLNEKRDDANKVKVPDVFADYTPQTWRLTTDPAVDNSPRAFIETSPMTAAANPGMSAGAGGTNSIDRLWVLWRKAGTGMTTSSLYWKTYRVGIDLSKLVDTTGKDCPPIKWSTDPTGNPVIKSGDVDIDSSALLGPWEVDRTGTKIFFTMVDERYPSLLRSGSQLFMGTGVSDHIATDVNGDSVADDVVPITVTYKDEGGTKHTVKATDVSWIVEAPERSLSGYMPDSSVNEGSVYAFADPGDVSLDTGTGKGTKLNPFPSSKIWVFWTSTKAGTSDINWATISPNFGAQ